MNSRCRPFWIVTPLGLAALVSGAIPSVFAYPHPVPDPEQSPAAKALTPEQHAWIRENPVVRYTFDPYWPPYGFLEPGDRPAGVDAALVPEILEAAGLGARFVPARSWDHAQELLKIGDVDIVSGVAETSERAQRWLFSAPYADYPVAIVSRQDGPFIATLPTLSGHTVALPKGHVTEDFIRANHPALSLVPCGSSEEALRFVAIGRCDFAIENILTADYIIFNRGLTNLKIAGVIDQSFALRLVTAPGNETLRDILDTAVRNLDGQTRREIVAKWISHDISHLQFLRKATPWLLALAGAFAGTFVFMLLSNRRLRREIALRRSAEAALERSNEEKAWLMSVAAHDLRSPLNAIMMAADLIDRDLSAETGAKPSIHRDALRSIQEGALRMRRLIENLLDLRAVEEGRLELEIEPADARALLDDVVTLYRPVAQQKGIALRIDPGAEPCVARCNADALRQVLENLVGNALKYSPADSEIVLNIQKQDEAIVVEVADTGPGIPSEECDRIFERFHRGRNRAHGRESSHGLGLSISKVLVEAQKGTIWCRSEPGRGSQFGFTVPAA